MRGEMVPLRAYRYTAPMHTRSRFHRHLRQGFKFAVSGVVGAALEFSIIYLLVGRLHLTPIISYVFSGGIPAVFVFLFNRHVTFRASEGSSSRQSRRFIIVYTLTFFLNYILSSSGYLLGMHYVLPLPMATAYGTTPLAIAYGAKVLAIGITAFVNYTFSHAFIFRDERVPPEAELAVF